MLSGYGKPEAMFSWANSALEEMEHVKVGPFLIEYGDLK